MQTVENLIRRRVGRRLIWFCTVCRYPTKRSLGLYGLIVVPKRMENDFKAPNFNASYIKYTMHNKFSNFLCFASFCAPLCAISNNFKCNDENKILGK